MKDRRFGWLARGPFALDATRPSSPVEEATSAVVSVTFRRSRLAPLVTEVYISLVSHESLTERVLGALACDQAPNETANETKGC